MAAFLSGLAIRQLTPKAKVCWVISTALYLALLITLSLDHWLVAPPKVDSPLLIWGIRIFALAFFLPAIIKAYARGFAWMCFVLLFYFSSAVVSGWAHQNWMGWLIAGECFLLFCSSILFVRWYFQKQ